MFRLAKPFLIYLLKFDKPSRTVHLALCAKSYSWIWMFGYVFYKSIYALKSCFNLITFWLRSAKPIYQQKCDKNVAFIGIKRFYISDVHLIIVFYKSIYSYVSHSTLAKFLLRSAKPFLSYHQKRVKLCRTLQAAAPRISTLPRVLISGLLRARTPPYVYKTHWVWNWVGI